MARVIKKSARSPNPIDVEVGKRIRIERLNKRMSQTELADPLGVTFQQVQKYERGSNRVGAGRLMAIAEKLDIPVTSFFSTSAVESAAVQSPLDLLTERRAIRLLKAFHQIESNRFQDAIVRFVELAAAKSSE
jgi:transcriptional regulator with XRE-family HTH domain